MGLAVSAKVIPIRRPAGRADEASDEALLSACALSDASALAVLFDRHHLRMYRFVTRVARTRSAETEDLVQDTFAAVWTSAHKYKGSSAGLTWVFGIAANLARNHARSRARGARALVTLTDLPMASKDAIDDVAARKQAMERIEHGLTALSHDQRVAFVMCDLEGISGVDAAKTLGVPAGTLWRRLHDARTKLRVSIDGDGS